MATYITVADVDTILGTDWTTPEKKDRAVMQANAYLTSLNLSGVDMDAIPDEVKQAGAELAKCADDGVLYQQQSSGSLEAKTVKAGSVTTSKTFGAIDSSSTKAQAEGIQFALALLNPWLRSSFGFDVYR
jgi:hypothetical protein